MGGVEIKPLNQIGNDERGKTSTFSIRETKNFVLIQRVKGSLSGNTYHKGISPNTNPKIFILLNGSIMFRYRHVNDTKHDEIHLSEPSLIYVHPYVAHSVEALEDIMMLECNSIEDIKDDRYREEVIK